MPRLKSRSAASRLTNHGHLAVDGGA
jgi:hypothetical protein